MKRVPGFVLRCRRPGGQARKKSIARDAFPTPFVKKIFLGTMSLPNSFSSADS